MELGVMCTMYIQVSLEIRKRHQVPCPTGIIGCCETHDMCVTMQCQPSTREICSLLPLNNLSCTKFPDFLTQLLGFQCLLYTLFRSLERYMLLFFHIKRESAVFIACCFNQLSNNWSTCKTEAICKIPGQVTQQQRTLPRVKCD